MGKIRQIEGELLKADSQYPFQKLLRTIFKEKAKSVSIGDEALAKHFWCYQTAVEIHKLFNDVWNDLRKKEYERAWCNLEQIEIKIKNLKRHFDISGDKFRLQFIERSVLNLQAIYPYDLFLSSEMVYSEKRCSVCNEIVSVRKPCGHKVGEIYAGEMCYRLVTISKILGAAIVQAPVHKSSVLFTVDDITGERRDNYNYITIEYLLACLKHNYEFWDLKVSYRFEVPTSPISDDDFCPCHSLEKYVECCKDSPGIRYPHFEILVKNPRDFDVFSRSRLKH
jgi:hypothetical protein